MHTFAATLQKCFYQAVASLALLFFLIGTTVVHAADSCAIVMGVDNSGSTGQTDPNRLRGVAAQLILDALVLPCDAIQVGTVFFNSQVTGDNALGAEKDARQRLASQLEETGHTDMEGAMIQALMLLENSNAAHKVIVLLT
ncbi:MAG TPA: hypothetical protein DEP36_15935, partial [Gammaproteobacteria bacterium]|nr:hypothetical protein [Gammaproteobacteria bacterium]